MSKLSSLIVDLQADTAHLKKGLDEAKGMLGGLEKKVDQATKAVGALFLLDKAKDAIVSLANFVKAGADAADQAGKMAQAAGTTVEQFSRYSYAASLSDISTEELASSMARLNKNMVEAAGGSRQQAAVFSAMGVSVKNANGSLRSADEVMTDVAEKFSRMKDGASKAALAQELFGKSGARLIPLLNQGRAGLRELADEADNFGLTITTEGAASAEMFNDSLTKMKKIGEGLALRVAQELTPSMTRLAEEFLKSAKNSDMLKMTAQGIAVLFKGLVSAGISVVGLLQHVGITLAALASAAVSLASGNAKGAKEAMRAAAEEIGKNFDNVKARLEAVWTTDPVLPLEKEKKASSLNADAIVKDMMRKQKATDDYGKTLAKLTKATEDLQFQALTFGFNDLELLEARVLFGDLSEEIRKTGDAGEEMAKKMLLAAKALHKLKMEQKTKDTVAGMRQGSIGGGGSATASNAAKSISGSSGPDLQMQLKLLDEAEAFDKKISTALRAAGTGILNGVGNAVRGLLGAMGGIGGIMNNFISTFKNEGFWEAIIGAIGEILSAAPAFGRVISIASGILETVVGAFDGLIEGIASLLSAVGWVIEVFVDVLKPLFDVIAEVLEDLGPSLFMMMSTIKVGITPLIKAISAVLKILGPILRILFEVIRAIVLFSYYILRTLAAIWNAIVNALAGYVNNFMKVIKEWGAKVGFQIMDFFPDWMSKPGDALLITTAGLEANIKELENASWDSVKAMQDEKEAQYEATGATKEMAKSAESASKAISGLTNVPALMKVNRLRGLSSDNADGSAPTINLFIDGKQVYTAMEGQHRLAEFYRNGGRKGRF